MATNNPPADPLERTPLEILSATFYTSDVTSTVRSLAADLYAKDQTQISFTPDYQLLGVDPLPGHMKPFVMVYRKRELSTDTEYFWPGPIQTVRVLEYTSISIVLKNLPILVGDPQDGKDGTIRILSATWWISDVTAFVVARRAGGVVCQYCFGESSIDPQPGINKTLSLTYRKYDGVSPFDPQIMVKTYREGAKIFVASSPSEKDYFTRAEELSIVEHQLKTTTDLVSGLWVPSPLRPIMGFVFL